MRIGLTLLNLNEIESIPSFMSRLDTTGFQRVFVVDGGSDDGSRELLEISGFDVIVQKARGRGEAFQIAFAEAQKFELDGLVFISTDGNESPEDLPKFLEAFSRGSEIVIGSRMIKGARNEEDDQIFRPRKIANKFFAMIAYILFGRGSKKITDPINGYRGITMSAWDTMKLDFHGFDIEYASSIQAYKYKLKVLEFPTIEGNRVGGKSGARAIPTTVAMLKVLRKMLFLRKV